MARSDHRYGFYVVVWFCCRQYDNEHLATNRRRSNSGVLCLCRSMHLQLLSSCSAFMADTKLFRNKQIALADKFCICRAVFPDANGINVLCQEPWNAKFTGAQYNHCRVYNVNDYRCCWCCCRWQDVRRTETDFYARPK